MYFEPWMFAAMEDEGIMDTRTGRINKVAKFLARQKILIGRDGNIVDMIINLPFVSRIHCTILYHCDTMEYEIVDLSHNGTFVNGNKRLLRDETYLLKPGNEICFGDKETIYKLG